MTTCPRKCGSYYINSQNYWVQELQNVCGPSIPLCIPFDILVSHCFVVWKLLLFLEEQWETYPGNCSHFSAIQNPLCSHTRTFRRAIRSKAARRGFHVHSGLSQVENEKNNRVRTTQYRNILSMEWKARGQKSNKFEERVGGFRHCQMAFEVSSISTMVCERVVNYF